MIAHNIDPLLNRPELHLAGRSFRDEPYGTPARSEILSEAGLQRAMAEIGHWPGYAPTPLVKLNQVAASRGVSAIYYKDEAGRFGLGSFKALGGAYAVMRLLQQIVFEQTGEQPSATDLASGVHADICRDVTVTCATDGNHGRSVAWGARTFGCRCVIYVHELVSQGRADAIAAYGAEVRRIVGNYDDAVRRAASDAAASGWFVVSDTSYPGYTDIPRDVMQGYGVMVAEALAQLPEGVLPTHVFVQGGVGGLAAAVCATLWERLGTRRPLFAIVEPTRAACLFKSAVAGHPVVVEGSLDTIMAGLACGEVSLLAWEILQPGTDAYLAIDDDAAAAAMRMMAFPAGGTDPIVAGESAVAGLAGFMQAAAHDDMREKLAIGPDGVVLIFGSEGATDPALYREIVGASAEEIAGSTKAEA